MTYFENRVMSLSLGNDGRRDGKWLINLYKNRPHAGIFPFALILCDIWAQKKVKPMPYAQSLLELVFKNAWRVDPNYTLQLYFYFNVIFIFHSFLAHSLPSVCPGKNVTCAIRIVPICLSWKGRDFCCIQSKKGPQEV